MKRQSGAVRILLYNWPIYVGTWVLGAVLLWVAALEPRFRLLAVLLGGIPILWSIVSLTVSWYIYDRSALRSARWITALLPATVERWSTIHAGLDAEVDLEPVLPGSCCARLDIFDPISMTSGSIGRARGRTKALQAAVPCSPTSLSLDSDACDAIIVAFTAHEIRDPSLRERFFEELMRCVRPGGRVVVVEHVRDTTNFLAFGPGWLHFLPRREWLRLAAKTGFGVACATRVTPWILALSLEKPS